MRQDKVLKEFRDAGALLEGHFVLSSGLHSRQYLQCARVLMNPARAARLCRALAKQVREAVGDVDYVVSPAMGGVIVGYEMGRQMKVPAMFLERVEGTFELRRGFALPKINGRRPRVLMVEDIVTTGLSSREAIAAIRAQGGNVVAGACLVDRSNGKAKIGVKLLALTGMKIETFEAKNLPDDLKNLPVVKPGSRNLKK
ncbi:MAG: orotate phosphoribosyltransferase [Parvibaculales bacterium]